jgi:putative spermidine/putrescine transport system substrate-binding protein
MPQFRAWFILVVAIFLSACGAPTPAAPTAAPVVAATAALAPTTAPAIAVTEPTVAPQPVVTGNFEDSYRTMTFEQIAAAARGQTVSWHMWGGDEAINTYVNGYIAKILKEQYDITLKQVPLTDTVDAVNKVLAEKQAGDANGSTDLIWINGENFRTMKEGGLLFRNWADKLPSNENIDWTSAAISYDFGFPVEYDESPWGSAQFVMEYDSARIPSPPKTIDELFAWACANPGKFTYPAPPDFTGSVFVRHVFYSAAGDYKPLLGEFDEAKYSPAAAKTWQMLNDVRPCLWREGATYPESSSKLYDLFANGEVWISMSYGPAHAANEVAKGRFPTTTRTWVFDSGTIGNTNYLAIPYNAPKKAAAMVLANLLLSPEAQIEAAKPEVMGWSTPLSFARLPQQYIDQFNAIPRSEATLDNATLDAAKLPELQSTWLTRIEKDWGVQVLEQ